MQQIQPKFMMSCKELPQRRNDSMVANYPRPQPQWISSCERVQHNVRCTRNPHLRSDVNLDSCYYNLDNPKPLKKRTNNFQDRRPSNLDTDSYTYIPKLDSTKSRPNNAPQTESTTAPQQLQFNSKTTQQKKIKMLTEEIGRKEDEINKLNEVLDMYRGREGKEEHRRNDTGEYGKLMGWNSKIENMKIELERKDIYIQFLEVKLSDRTQKTGTTTFQQSQTYRKMKQYIDKLYLRNKQLTQLQFKKKTKSTAREHPSSTSTPKKEKEPEQEESKNKLMLQMHNELKKLEESSHNLQVNNLVRKSQVKIIETVNELLIKEKIKHINHKYQHRSQAENMQSQ